LNAGCRSGDYFAPVHTGSQMPQLKSASKPIAHTKKVKRTYIVCQPLLSMYKKIIFFFLSDRFPGKQVPDIIEYDLHNPVLMWISNLAIDYEKNN
jgi:hypothetical protein